MKRDNIFLIVIAITCLTIALIMINGVKHIEEEVKYEEVPEWELEEAERKVEIR
jgi:hypothetical protein